MGEVVAIKKGTQGLSGRYKKEVVEYGYLMFGEQWRLESLPVSGTEPMKRWSIMVLTDGKWVARSAPLPLIDFILFWDGFRLCADEMRA